MIGPVREIGRTDGTEWTGPVSGTIDKDSDMRREWVGRVRLKMHRLRIPHWSKAVVVSVREIGKECLDYIWRDGWINIAGQWANTISARKSGDCYVGCKGKLEGRIYDK